MKSPHLSGPNAPARVADRATWLVSRAYARSTGLLADGFDIAGGGLRGYHYRLLAALEEAGPASQAELGRSTGIDRSDVTAALTELEGQRLISRSVDPDNRRRNIVAITRAGRRRLVVLDRVVSDVQDSLLRPLNSTERRQFLSLLRRVVDADISD